MKKYLFIVLFVLFSFNLYASENEYTISESEYGVFSRDFLNVTNTKSSSSCNVKLNNKLLFTEHCNSENEIKLLYFSNLSARNNQFYFIFNINNKKLLVIEFFDELQLILKHKAYIEWDSSIPEIIVDNDAKNLIINKYDKNKIVAKYKYQNGKVSKIK